MGSTLFQRVPTPCRSPIQFYDEKADSLIAGALSPFAVVLLASAVDDIGLTRMVLVEWGKCYPAQFKVFAKYTHAALPPYGGDSPE